MGAKVKIKDFIIRLEERNKKHAPIKLYDNNFLGMHKKAKFICNYNHIFESISKNVMDGHGCPVCTKKIKYTKETLIEILKSTEYTILNFKEYKNVKSKMHFICKNGHKFQASLKGVLSNKHGCSKCSGKYRITKYNVCE